MTSRMKFGAGLAAALTLLASPALAQETLTLQSGKATLPISGVEVDIAARPGTEFSIYGSWGFFPDQNNAVDARDTIEEYPVGGDAPSAGSWLYVEFLDDAGCMGSIGNVPFENVWMSEETLWGNTWLVRGGNYMLDRLVPGSISCRTYPDGTSVVFYRFLPEKPLTTSKVEILTELKGSAAGAAFDRAIASGTSAPVKPLHVEHVFNSGDAPAVRSVTLTASGLTVNLPDDGFFWNVGEYNNIDMFSREVPVFPEMHLETARIAGRTCKDVFDNAGFTSEALPVPPGIPASWMAETHTRTDKFNETALCHPVADGVLIASLYTPKETKNLADIAPLLGALAEAAR